MHAINFNKNLNDVIHFQDYIKLTFPSLEYINYSPTTTSGSLHFDTEPNEAEIINLNNLITAYVNPVVINSFETEVILVSSLKTYNTISYTDICSIIINPQKQNLQRFIISCNLEDINIPSQANDPNFKYDIIIYDAVGFSTIASQTYTNASERIFSIDVPAYNYLALRNLKVKCKKYDLLVGRNIKINYVSYVYI